MEKMFQEVTCFATSLCTTVLGLGLTDGPICKCVFYCITVVNVISNEVGLAAALLSGCSLSQEDNYTWVMWLHAE